MVLVTGGTGFIGTHLLEKLVSQGKSVRALVRRARTPRVLPAGVETFYGDLASGAGLLDALRGVDTVIHLAGVTKALRAEDYYSGNVRATEQLAHALAGRDVRLVHVSSLAAIGPSTQGLPLGEDTEPHPLTHYGKSKLEAERVVRSLLPDAVIVRPPVVYGPRDTDVFQLLKSISKGMVLEIAGGERWFSAIYVHDLVEGLLAAAATPWRRGADLFPGACQGSLLAPTRDIGGAYHGADPARVDGAVRRSPRGGCVRRSLGTLQRKAGNRFAREGRRGALYVVDLRYQARRSRTRVRGADLVGRWPVRHTVLVQGGGLAEVLSVGPRKHDTRFWAVDKVIVAYFACAVLLILGWWSKLPQALRRCWPPT